MQTERGYEQSPGRSSFVSPGALDRFNMTRHLDVLRLVPLAGHSRAPRITPSRNQSP